MENLVESLIENAEAYGKTTYELSKLKLLEGVTVVISALLSKLIFMLVISLFAFVLSVGISLMLGDLLGKSYYGFFIVALFYLMVGVVFKYTLQKWLKKSIADKLILEMLQK